MLHTYISPLFFGSLCGLMLTFPALAAQSALAAMQIFAQRVLPSLFPFSVCALMLTQNRRLPAFALYLLSFLGGSPAGAHLFEGAALTRAQARRAAAVTGVMSPMFFLFTIAADTRTARLLWLIHILSALCMLPVFRAGKEKARIALPARTLPEALQKSALSMLHVCGCITFFSVVAQLLRCALPLGAFASVLLHALLESAGGSVRLFALPLPRAQLLMLLSFCCAFGGVSITLQNAAVWRMHHIGTRFLLLAGLLRGAAAATISLLFFH